MNRHVELALGLLDAFWLWRFDEGAHQSLRRSQCHWGGSGVEVRQGEDRLVILLDGRLVIAMMVCEMVLRGVTVNQELGMPVLLVLVDMLGRSQRQQAEPQAEHARDDRGHPHASILCDAGPRRQT